MCHAHRDFDGFALEPELDARAWRFKMLPKRDMASRCNVYFDGMASLISRLAR